MPTLPLAPFRNAFAAAALLSGTASGGLHAQSWASSFESVKFDRGATPCTMTLGGLAVEAASGALSVDLGLGPGIGRGNLRFQPRLSGRFAPNVKVIPTSYVGPPDTPPYLWDSSAMLASFTMEMASMSDATSSATLNSGGGASLSPGSLDLVCNSQGGNRLISNFTLPNGASGSIFAPASAAPLASVDPARILAAFGYGASTTLAPEPSPKTTVLNYPLADRALLQQVGSGDELVLGLQDPAFPIVEVTDLYQSAHPVLWRVPARILVVQGDVAVEFVFVNGILGNYSYPITMTARTTPVATSGSPLRTVHYLPSRILPRWGGESIAFTYPSSSGMPFGNGVDYTASWIRNGSVRASVGLTYAGMGDPAGPANVPPLLDGSPGPTYSALGSPTLPAHNLVFRVSYAGENTNPSSYRVEAYALNIFNVPVYTASNLPSMGQMSEAYDSLRSNLQPTKVVQEDDGQSITFAWGYSDASVPLGYVGNPPTPTGDTYRPTVLSQVSGPGRSVNFTWQNYEYLANTESIAAQGGGFSPLSQLIPSWFWGIVRKDDQDLLGGTTRTTRHTRVVPVPNRSTGTHPAWTSTAFYDVEVHPDHSATAHLFVEPLNVAGGCGSTSDTPANQAQTAAFLKHLERERREYAPGVDWSADVALAASASAHQITRLDRFDFRRVGNPGGTTGFGSVPYATRTQAKDRDTGFLSWKEKVQWDAQAARAWVQEVSRSYAGTDLAATAMASLASQGISATDAPASGYDTSTTLTPGPDFALWFPHRITGSQTLDQPYSGTTFNADGTILTTILGAGPALTTTSTGYAQGLPGTLTLSGPFDGSGQVQVGYSYDASGFLASISPAGVTWQLKQTSDALGRPLVQKDANSLASAFSWDPEGRVSRLQPPGETATAITYDPAVLSATVTRGTLWSCYTHDGFGQLRLWSRSDGSGNLSHKSFGYDLLGRKIYESVWLSGAGTLTESPGAGTFWGFDDRGRPSGSADPNGRTETIAYAGSRTIVTVAASSTDPSSTTFTRDPLGRLTQVNDALGNLTTYSYAGSSGRILTVQQQGGSSVQTRSWGYHPTLAWLTSLTQPESGTTTYSDFTVAGKPRTTTYAGGLVVSITYDLLGRPLTVQSQDSPATVNQAFTYDSPGTYGASNGRLVRAQDSRNASAGVVRESYFDTSLNAAGHLTKLATTVWGSGTSGSQVYAQTFAYDAMGRRTDAVLDGRTMHTDFVDATDAALDVTFGSASVTTRTLARVVLFDPLSWMPSTITLGASGAATYLRYRPDQTALASLSHAGPFLNWKWNYTYDAHSRLVADGTDAFTYDLLDRLSTANLIRQDGDPTNPGTASQAFQYDAFGNITSIVSSGSGLPAAKADFSMTSDQQTAMAVNNRLPYLAGSRITGAEYDARGNLTHILYPTGTSDSMVTLSYDALGRVIQLQQSGSPLRLENYTYDADGLRTRIETYLDGVLQSVTHRIYDDQRRLVSEYVAPMAQ